LVSVYINTTLVCIYVNTVQNGKEKSHASCPERAQVWKGSKVNLSKSERFERFKSEPFQAVDFFYFLSLLLGLKHDKKKGEKESSAVDSLPERARERERGSAREKERGSERKREREKERERERERERQRERQRARGKESGRTQKFIRIP
jgi:hypothetical protein